MKKRILFVILLSLLGVNQSPFAADWRSLSAAADSLSAQQMVDSAIILGNHALKMVRKDERATPIDEATLLFQLGLFYHQVGNISKAESLLFEASSSVQDTVREAELILSQIQAKLGNFCAENAEYHDADSILATAVRIQRRLLGDTSQVLAVTLASNAHVNRVMGRFGEAEEMFREALAIQSTATAIDSVALAESYELYGFCLWVQGKDAEAELLALRSLKIRQKVFGDIHAAVAKSLHLLSLIYRIQGRRDDAIDACGRSLVIKERLYGPNHNEVAKTLTVMGLLCMEAGRDAEAETYQKRALAIRERVFGPEHPDDGENLTLLARLYLKQGRFAEAESLVLRTLAIDRKTLGPNHVGVSDDLFDLANVYTRKAKFAQAESLYHESLRIRIAVTGKTVRVAEAFDSLAHCYRIQGKLDSSLAAFREAFDIQADLFKYNGISLSEKNALVYSEQMRATGFAYLSVYQDMPKHDRQGTNNAAAVILLSKGAVSDEIIRRNQALAFELDSLIRILVDSVRALRLHRAEQYVSGPGKRTLETFKRVLASLDRGLNIIESELAMQSMSFRRQYESQSPTVEGICAALPEHYALVEYMRYRYFATDVSVGQDRYMVCVFTRRGVEGTCDLGSAAIIDSGVAAYRQHLDHILRAWPKVSSVDDSISDYLFTRLYSLVWSPVSPLIGIPATVLIAPDGPLNLVSFAHLKNRHKYLIEDYAVHYLTSARDLSRISTKEATNKGLIEFADPDYSAPATVRLQMAERYGDAPTGKQEGNGIALRNVRTRCSALNEITLSDLPYTRRESDTVAAVWRSLTSEPVTTLMGASASEEAFKRECVRKRVVHIATHGFFRPASCDSAGRSKYPGNASKGENPLLSSGLFLAGANLHGAGADIPGAEDGVLTAMEVSSLNLTGTEWVVLSACETGLGGIQSGEGVYGLRRAFQMAGARTVISALWQVPDKETSRLMAYLYHHQSDNLAQTFRNLALDEIRKERVAQRLANPLLWSSFVAVGGWGPSSAK